ncbi:MAG: hypothetical protein RLZZ38_1320 [Bacteroidota bacterium]|jgi:hypothetical protein
MKKTITLLAVITLMTSCMMTKTPVGAYLETPGKEVTFDKGKQFWLFWGIMPIGRTHVNTPSNGNCQVVTKIRLTDFIISGLTGGIVTSTSIKVEVKEQ